MCAEYIGIRVDKKHLEQAKKEILNDGEKIEGIFVCGITRTGGGRGLTFKDYLIVTNERAIAWGRGLLSKNLEIINYDKITNVQTHQGIFTGEIEFNVFGKNEKFNYMPKADVPIAKKMIDEHILSVGKSSIPGNIDEKLGKLNDLYKKGLISKGDFEEQKKRVLREI